MHNTNDAVLVAENIAESVLFPAALQTDRSPLLPRENLDALADAGLYGMFGPRSLGGYEADLVTASAVVERIASGCLTTALVWLQHHGLVGNLLMSSSTLRESWLGDLCTGARRSGIVFTGLLPGPSMLHAVPQSAGWRLEGHAPWVSGWGRIDTLQVAARGPDDKVVTVAVGDLDRSGIAVEPHRLAAMDASGTVKLTFSGVPVEPGAVLSVQPHEPGAVSGLSLRLNGSLALGVVRRCCMLLDSGTLEDELESARAQLDHATDESIAGARGTASALAVRASALLLVSTGSRSIELDNHAQRLAREAMFLLVFGSRPAIKDALLAEL